MLCPPPSRRVNVTRRCGDLPATSIFHFGVTRRSPHLLSTPKTLFGVTWRCGLITTIQPPSKTSAFTRFRQWLLVSNHHHLTTLENECVCSFSMVVSLITNFGTTRRCPHLPAMLINPCTSTAGYFKVIRYYFNILFYYSTRERVANPINPR